MIQAAGFSVDEVSGRLYQRETHQPALVPSKGCDAEP